MNSSAQASGVTAIVLAAGMSRRMGQPKQILRWQKKTLLQHSLDNVRASRVGNILVVLGAAAEEVRSQIATNGLKLVINPDYQQGMGTSLRAGTAALGPDVKAAFVVLADQPLVRTATLDRMIACHEASAPQVLIPLYRGFRGNPVLIDRSLFPELLNLSGDVGCRGVFGRHTQGIQKIEVDDPGILLDIDSADDLNRLSFSSNPLAHFHAFEDIEAKNESLGSGPELVIVGQDAVAHAVAEFAHLLGFTITIVDPLLAPQEFPRADRLLHRLDFSLLHSDECYIVIASRGQFDEDAVEQALSIRAQYVGVLANRQRAEEIFEGLRQRGVSDEKISRVNAPIGLAIGAETAEELALSIMAEVIAVRRKNSGRKN
jgi:molybdenum cofactor cytidylyltransferase